MSSQDQEPIAEPAADFRQPLILSLILIGFMTALSGWAWLQLESDARIPIHWGIDGQADGFGGRNMLFLMPAITLGTVGLFWVIPRIEPRKGNLLRSSKAYHLVWIGLLAFDGGLHAVMVAAALGKDVAVERYIAIGTGLLFAVIGNSLGKVRSNFMFGVRTPWTLSSELSWNKTNRLTGWCFVLYGLAMMWAGCFSSGGRIEFWATAVFIPVIVIISLVYSYLVWRQDPNKQSLGRGSSA